MDKITRYQNIVLQFLHHYKAETKIGAANSDVKYRILADRENNSFQLLSIGWKKHDYMFSPIFHFDIIDGKIWLQCNNTESEVVDELMAAGVERQDIVLGFVPPYSRQYSGFAVA